MISNDGYITFKKVFITELSSVIPEFQTFILKSLCRFYEEYGVIYPIGLAGTEKSYNYVSDIPISFLNRKKVSDILMEKVKIDGLGEKESHVMRILDFIHHSWSYFFERVRSNISECIQYYAVKPCHQSGINLLSKVSPDFHMIKKLYNDSIDILFDIIVNIGAQSLRDVAESAYIDYHDHAIHINTILKSRTLPPQYRKLIKRLVAVEPTFVKLKTEYGERILSALGFTKLEFMNECVKTFLEIGDEPCHLTFSKRSPVVKGKKSKSMLYHVNSFLLDSGSVEFVESSVNRQHESIKGQSRIFDYKQYVYL